MKNAMNMLRIVGAQYKGMIKQGSRKGYDQLNNYIQNNDLSKKGQYDSVASQIDMDSYINYHIAQIYLANGDWPSNNVMIWNAPAKQQWRWMLFDTDGSTNSGIWGERLQANFHLPNGSSFPLILGAGSH